MTNKIFHHHLLNQEQSLLSIDIKPALLVKHGQLVMLSCATSGIVLCDLEITTKILSAVLLLFYFVKIYNQSVSCKIRIKYNTSGWTLTQTDETEYIHILPSSVLTKHIIVLHIRYLSGTKSKQKRFKSLLITKQDAVNEEDFRRLTVKLKCSLIKQEQTTVSIVKIKSTNSPE
ncbi:protein YgfX [Methylocucumis oryzae]|uniref:Uncharacterized protein n=1 Tax=Methylocucumis oryzae TaxID=1632867 RepID=A0A0F3IF09_9GAMM|nr:protein YgfX [Methylocucumis oryzae]KJV05262.1 hypothetical protein VZ94_19395 [Methylocucumis oryzae]